MHGNGLKPRCTRLLSANFVREVYGSDARCKAAGGEKSGAQLPESRATGIQVSGDRARARITLAVGRIRRAPAPARGRPVEARSLPRGQGYDTQAIECVRRGIRALSDHDVLEHATRDKSAPPPATERIAAMIAACR